jgi:hypothetical protein
LRRTFLRFRGMLFGSPIFMADEPALMVVIEEIF